MKTVGRSVEYARFHTIPHAPGITGITQNFVAKNNPGGLTMKVAEEGLVLSFANGREVLVPHANVVNMVLEPEAAKK